MKIVYKSFGKIFDTRSECLRYENRILADKKLIAHNIALNYRFHITHVLDPWRAALPCFFTKSRRRFTFGKYEGCFVCTVILEDSKYVERCQSKVKGFVLTENEQLLLDTINNIKYGPDISLQYADPDFKIIDLLKERYLEYYIDPDRDKDFDKPFVYANDKIVDNI